MDLTATTPKTLPKQNAALIEQLADRFVRAKVGHDRWAETAKECVDFFEGRQWSAEQITKLEEEGRPILTFNKIGRVVRLVLGYMQNYRTDATFIPANEGPSSPAVAEVLGRIYKQISTHNQLPFVDVEVFMDGIVTGRGFFDCRLSFDENDFGEVKIRSADPFSTIIDPDCNTYDLNETAKFVMVSRMASLDEIEAGYGREAAERARAFAMNLTGYEWSFGLNRGFADSGLISPPTNFSMTQDGMTEVAENYGWEMVDPARKNVRILDIQHQVVEVDDVLVDLETGDKLPLPGRTEMATLMPGIPFRTARQMFVEKSLYHAERVGNPLGVAKRPIKRIRWSVMIADTLVHDDWSIYDAYTVTPFFPYFRRGMTRGMVADMLDPQREINKRRSNEIEIIGRGSKGMWLIPRGVVRPEEEDHWRKNSSMPGFVGFYDPKHSSGQIPKYESPAPFPANQERLEERATRDLLEVSGVNESALGQIDRAQSGVAIRNRQQQTVVGIQPFIDNFKRTKQLLARHCLEIIQKHYREERVFRILGEDGKLSNFIINQRQFSANGDQIDRLNDVTLGKYMVTVDETPLSASFQDKQFEEMLQILQAIGPVGQALMQARPDLIVDMSSIPRKEEFKAALATLLNPQAMQPQGAVSEAGPMQPPPVPPTNPSSQGMA